MSDYIGLIDSLDVYLSNKRYEFLVEELLETLQKEVVSLIKSNLKHKELQCLEDNQRNLYREINKYNFEDIEVRKIFSLAYMKAIIDIKSYADKESLKEENSERLLKSHKHLSNLIECLYNENSLPHQELADRMEISKSNLSNFINKPEITKLITRNRYGKKVYYSISSDGHKLYKHIAINKSRQFNVEQYTDLLIQMIDSIQTEISSEYVNINRFWNNLNGKFNDNIAFTKSSTIKNKLSKLVGTINKQKPYNWYNLSVKFIEETDDRNKPIEKVLALSSRTSKGDIYEYYK